MSNVGKQSTVFVKDVNVPTECVVSRKLSCRGTGLKIEMNNKVGESSLIDVDRMR
jgi:hypothetical protein